MQPSVRDATGDAGDPDWDVTATGQPEREFSFTTSEGSWLSLDVSPDGTTIAFDLLGDIYLVPASGGEASLVRGGPTMDRMPAFSPDGSRLLYLSDADGWDNVWACALDGSAGRQLTHERTDLLTGPIWGPDARSIVAALIRTDFPRRALAELRCFELIGAADPGSGRVIVPAPDNGRDVLEASCSADGRFVYYTERLTAPHIYVDANHINFAIKRRDLATGAAETVASGFGGAICPQVSPDGRHVAFVRRVMARTVLFVVDLATGEQRPVYDGLDRDNGAVWELQGNYYPRFAWFPDNRRVAIWAQGGLLDIDTVTGAVRPIEFRVTSRHRVVERLAFRPELAPERFRVRAVKQLAATARRTGFAFTAVGAVWRTESPDAEPVRLTGPDTVGFDPAYSADETQLAYVEWHDEHGSTVQLLAEGADKARSVVASSGVLRDPSFSPDGNRLTYRIQDPDSGMGGARVKAGVYWADAASGESRYVCPGQGQPRFSPDGERIYFCAVDDSGLGLVERLVSVRPDGLDRREHAASPHGDVTELRISPDLRWITFRDSQHYYLVPARDGAAPMTVCAAMTEAPVRRLTRDGGYGLTWSTDGSSLHWACGPHLYRLDLPGDLETHPEPPAPHSELRFTLPTDVPGGCVAFVHGRILTMRDDDTVVEDGAVVVTGNRITAVGAAAEVDIPAGAHVVDLAGRTLLPGLVDGHGHIDSAWSTGVAPRQQPARFAALAFGVTTNFDPFPSEVASYESTEATLAGHLVGPRWIGTGRAIHGRPQIGAEMYHRIDDYADAQEILARKAALGGTSIKSYKQPARRKRQMLIKAAREAGLNVVVEGETHFYNNVSMIIDGHTNLEHNLPLANYYDDLVQFMVGADAHNTPTLVVCFGELFGENYLYQTTRAWTDPKVRTFVQETLSGYSPLGTPYGAPPYARGMTSIHVADEIYDIGFRSVARSVKKLDDAGVIINVGSHGEVPGLAMHWEMRLLAEGGMAPMRVLRAATVNVARSLGVDDQIGTVEVGKLADLIVLDADPLADITNSNSVALTMVNGRLYDAQTMDEIGNRPRARGRFYWELQDRNGIDWNEAWARR